MKRIFIVTIFLSSASLLAAASCTSTHSLDFNKLLSIISPIAQDTTDEVLNLYGLDPIKYRNGGYFYDEITHENLNVKLFGPKSAETEQKLRKQVDVAFEHAWAKHISNTRQIEALKQDIKSVITNYFIEKELYAVLRGCNCLNMAKRTAYAVFVAQRILQKFPKHTRKSVITAFAPGHLIQEYLLLQLLSDHGYTNLSAYVLDFSYPDKAELTREITENEDTSNPPLSYRMALNHLQERLPKLKLYSYKNPYDYINFVQKCPTEKADVLSMVDPDLTVSDVTPFPAQANLFGLTPKQKPGEPRYTYGPNILITLPENRPVQLYVHKAVYDTNPIVRDIINEIRAEILKTRSDKKYSPNLKEWLTRYESAPYDFDLVPYSDPHLAFQDLVKETAKDDALIFMYYRYSPPGEYVRARVRFLQVNKHDYLQQDVFGPIVGAWLLKQGISAVDEKGMIIDLPNPAMPWIPLLDPHYARIDLATGNLITWNDIKESVPEEPLSVAATVFFDNITVTENLEGKKELLLSKNDINTLEGLNDIPKVEEVQILHLNDNRLKQIPSHAFVKLKNLEEIFLDNNPLEYIADNAFEGLTKLTHISLSETKLSKEQ